MQLLLGWHRPQGVLPTAQTANFEAYCRPFWPWRAAWLTLQRPDHRVIDDAAGLQQQARLCPVADETP